MTGKQALNKYADVSAADLVKKYEAVERQIKKGDYIKQKTTRTKFEQSGTMKNDSIHIKTDVR